MKKEKFFFVIYFKNEKVKQVLNGLRLVADPSQNNIAHLTVKGPYISKQLKKLNEDKKLIEGKSIDIIGVGNFFTENQNTVFFKCAEKVELKKIWETKEIKTYKEFHPHITIYDGNNKKYARNLYKTLNSHRLEFSLEIDELDLYSTNDKFTLFNLKNSVNYEMLSHAAGHKVSSKEIASLNEDSRLEIIDKLSETLIEIVAKISANSSMAQKV